MEYAVDYWLFLMSLFLSGLLLMRIWFLLPAMLSGRLRSLWNRLNRKLVGARLTVKSFLCFMPARVNRWLRRLTLIAYIMMLLLTVLIIRSCYLLIQNLP